MKTEAGISPSWADENLWPVVRQAPYVVVLAGIGRSNIVKAALADKTLTDVVIPRIETEPCAPPCDALLWRLETAAGQSLNEPSLLASQWHRRPYAMTVRLVRYQPGSMVPEILDEGTIGTRGSFAAFQAAVDRLAMRFVRDAALGRARGPGGSQPAATAHGIPGWLSELSAKWHGRLMAEWWSIGSINAPPDRLLLDGNLGDIRWYRTKVGDRYLADPFPWPGTDRILCEEMPMTGDVGRIVSVAPQDGDLGAPRVLLDDGYHHSYPCAMSDGETVYCVPESTERGGTRIHQLDDDGRLVAVCEVAPHSRLADPTLFQWNGRYWLGCTDLDLGAHDNLCLLHAPSLTGPWTPHARWPVKIDIRGARPAGMVFNISERLFRPGQDCAATYGAAVVIHEIHTLSETDFYESVLTVLQPDRSGPFPHGLHTLVHDGERFWLDGKRFVLDLGLFRRKFIGRASRALSRSGKM